MRETALVTGGRGRSGRWIVDELTESYDVVCVDLEHPGFEVDERPHVEFRSADLTDRGQAFDLIAEFDPAAVVHWAALPSPTRHPGGLVFETNALGVYNVLVAAGRAGADVVWASSESAYGHPFAEERRVPEELPITESHPLEPEDPYGTSKVAGEEVAKMVARRYGVSVVSARPSWIQYPGEYACREFDSLAAGTGNFWSYVDVRDVAEFVAAALESMPDGHEAVNVAAADNYAGRGTVALFEDFFGSVPAECSLTGEESALSTAKAARRFGWRPDHAWREAERESVAPPSLLASGSE